MGDHYYTFYVGDYLRDTQDLSMVEDGAYRRLLDRLYTGKTLPLDKKRLYLLTKAGKKNEKKAVDFVLDKFFYIKNGNYHNKRADIEIDKRNKYLQHQSDKGKKSAAKKRANRGYNRGQNPVITERQPAANKPSPSPSIKEKKNTSKKKSESHSIPENFQITPEMTAWFKNQKFKYISIETATEEFIDYWISAGGKKSDWVAAWRNGMRKAEAWAKRDNGDTDNEFRKFREKHEKVMPEIQPQTD